MRFTHPHRGPHSMPEQQLCSSHGFLRGYRLRTYKKPWLVFPDSSQTFRRGIVVSASSWSKEPELLGERVCLIGLSQALGQ